MALDEILGGCGLLLIKGFPHFSSEKKRGNRTIVVHPGPIGSFWGREMQFVICVGSVESLLN